MPSKKDDLASRIAKIEKSVRKVEETLARLSNKVGEQKKETKKLTSKMETRVKRESIMMEAMGMSSRTKKGDRAILGNLNDSIMKLEEYLLRTSERIENILNALKSHREFLVKMNKRVNKVGMRERIGMELDIMKNTLTIMAIGGVKLDESLFHDVRELRAASNNPKVSSTDLKKRKGDLDKKFGDELGRYDLEKIWKKKKDIPGYV
ncbi:MAG: hypothetical protein E3J35_07710 [Methanomassiliicoccales archaeon]|nr:MAG: hypothetical protein E3J35_07710 [Methanomassiliicoccales archaeon]